MDVEADETEQLFDDRSFDPRDLDDRRVGGEPAEGARHLERFAEAAEAIDEVAIERLLPRPDAPLRDGVHFLLRHVPPLRHAVEERVVDGFDRALRARALVVGEAAEWGVDVGVGGGPVGLHVHADLSEEPARVGLAVEDADRAGRGEGLGEDRLPRARDVVAAARRDRAHADDERLARFARSESSRHITSAAVVAPPGLSIRRTTLRTFGSSRSVADGVGDRVRADELHVDERDVLRATIDDVTVDVEDGHLRARAELRPRDDVRVVLFVGDRVADQILRRALDLVVEGELVDELRGARFFREGHPVLGGFAYVVDRQVPPLRDVLREDRLVRGVGGLGVGAGAGARLRVRVHLGGAFVGRDADELPLDPELLEQPGEVEVLVAEADVAERPGGVEDGAIRVGADVERVDAAVLEAAEDFLPARAEDADRVGELLGVGERRGRLRAEDERDRLHVLALRELPERAEEGDVVARPGGPFEPEPDRARELRQAGVHVAGDRRGEVLTDRAVAPEAVPRDEAAAERGVAQVDLEAGGADDGALRVVGEVGDLDVAAGASEPRDIDGEDRAREDEVAPLEVLRFEPDLEGARPSGAEVEAEDVARVEDRVAGLRHRLGGGPLKSCATAANAKCELGRSVAPMLTPERPFRSGLVE